LTILKQTKLVGTVERLCLHNDASTDICSSRVDSVNAVFAGLTGESHSGLTRKSCVRVKEQYTENTIIRNTRQISVISVEELALIAEQMGLDNLQPEWLGANLSISGIPDLTLLPPASRLLFSSGAAIVVDVENAPCKYPAEIIDRHFPGKGRKFVKSALHRRGFTAWVEREGTIRQGDLMNVHIPPQRLYPQHHLNIQ